MKKFLSLLMIAMFISFSGCAAENQGERQISGTVKIQSSAQQLLDAQIQVKGENPTAADAIKQACQEKKLAFTFRDGLFDNFGGEASTSTDGWLLYSEGKLAEVGAADIRLSEGFQVEFRYENYDMAFQQ